MSQRDGFGSGFFWGVVFGSAIGAVVGAIVANDRTSPTDKALINGTNGRQRKPLQTEATIEAARHSLEEKIAQLNSAIDDVRQQLGEVNGNAINPESN